MALLAPQPIIAAEALEQSNDEVVDSNVATVNALFEGYLTEGEISTDALRSYYVDFYLTQVLEGGFEQFIFTSDLDETLLSYIKEGLEAMSATEHAKLFERGLQTFRELPEEEQDLYLHGDLDDEDLDDLDDWEDEEEWESDAERSESLSTENAAAEYEATDEGEDEDLDDDEEPGPFDDLDEEIAAQNEHTDLTELNGAWLRTLDLEELPEAEIAQRIHAISSTVPDREEREAAAREEAEGDMPDFELIIRELCDVVGYELQDISLGQPDYEYDGGKVFAWHFSTDHGDYVMVEEETEAYMLDPKDNTVVAAVEFDDEDDATDAPESPEESEAAAAAEGVKASV